MHSPLCAVGLSVACTGPRYGRNSVQPQFERCADDTDNVLPGAAVFRYTVTTPCSPGLLPPTASASEEACEEVRFVRGAGYAGWMMDVQQARILLRSLLADDIATSAMPPSPISGLRPTLYFGGPRVVLQGEQTYETFRGGGRQRASAKHQKRLDVVLPFFRGNVEVRPSLKPWVSRQNVVYVEPAVKVSCDEGTLVLGEG